SIQANGTSVVSVNTTAVQRIVVDPLAGDDQIWVGNGTQALTPILEVVSSMGHDTLYSKSTTFGAGLADGTQKVIQSNNTVYALPADGGLWVNGTLTWANTRGFALGADGSLWKLDTSGTLGHNVAGAWQWLSNVTKFAQAPSGTVYALTA